MLNAIVFLIILRAAPVLSSWIPSASNIFVEVATWLEPTNNLLAITEVNGPEGRTRRCRLMASGVDDTDGLELAVAKCGSRGIIDLPHPRYIISRPLDLRLEHSTLNVHGFLTFTDDLDYWKSNHIAFPFQNQSLGLVFHGHHFTLDGHNTGGIDGQGQKWYDDARREGNKYGRPMSLAISHSHDVVIKNWSIIQPQFWASLVAWSRNVLLKNVYVNATSYNPESWEEPDGKSWLQNTDGLDTYNADNVTVENFVYQGGDDCLALKANSTAITFRNITCVGGTGIAIGSLAQYPGVTDIIEDVWIEDVKLLPAPSNQCALFQGLLLKAWGAETHGTPPNGGGGGLGYAHNITFKDIYMEGIIRPIVLQSTLTYLSNVTLSPGNFEWSDLHFRNITAMSKYNRLIWLDCPAQHPCRNFTFRDMHLIPGATDHPELRYVCNNVVLGGKDGLNECHPSDSMLERREDGWPHE
ncbi:putative polygalacturonase [Kockovaella imperatae]|uniref:galacturonan 1,4-alpha-galacturonidase n=1 Tax=Kockovaella imperatae TaxID=4999 RepID=A0A1Y1UDH6_9TREE|nr:putative polygalacturonase [Kockovaella imperatae]ORX36062.1 putative polygalacturonase [Kockovaella imperatae]